MKKLITTIILIVIVALFAFALAACSQEAKSLEFSAGETVSLYLDESSTYTPDIIVKPKRATYTLSVSNDTMAKVNDDGISLTLLRAPTIFTVTATSGDVSVTQTIKLFSSGNNASDENNVLSGEYYTVVFQAVYGGVADQIVAPGETATEPEMPDEVNGYILEGWYSQDDAENHYDFSTPVTSNLILVAKWIPITSPILTYGNYNGKIYVTGMYYPYIHYTDIYFPEVAPEGSMINSRDISGQTVCGVYSSAFKDNKYLKTLHIPSTFDTIWENAFENCTALESVSFSGTGLLEIQEGAFYGCSALSDFNMPSTVTDIGNGAFAECSSLTACELPSALVNLGGSAFYNCTKLASIGFLSAGLSSLKTSVFENCAITSIDLSSIKTLEKKAFCGCLSLATVTGLENVESISFEVFKDTPFLNNAYNASKDGAVYAGTKLLYFAHKSNVFAVTINPNTTYIAGGAIYNLTEDHTFIFGDNVPTRNEYAIQTSSEYIELIVPENSYQSYYDAWTVNRSQLYYEKTLDNLTIRVRNGYSGGELISRKIAVMKYAGTAEVVNVKALLDDAYGDAVSYSVLRINNSAFYDFYKSNLSETLKRIILPTSVEALERSSIGWLKNLESIEFQGDASDFTSLTVATGAIIEVSTAFKIYVPSALLTKYKTAFGNFYSAKVVAK